MGLYISNVSTAPFLAKIVRVVLAMLLLTAGLTAQRYTGHDHAVFHRSPAPPTAAKHQPPSTTGNSKPQQKTVPANTTSQPAPRAALQSHPEAGVEQASVPAKSVAGVEYTPHL